MKKQILATIALAITQVLPANALTVHSAYNAGQELGRKSCVSVQARLVKNEPEAFEAALRRMDDSDILTLIEIDKVIKLQSVLPEHEIVNAFYYGYWSKSRELCNKEFEELN